MLKTGNDVSETDKSTCTFEIEVNSSYVKANSGTSLYIAYNAVLNENAVIFNSNENNTAKIQYSNNPYDTSSTETTPEKEVKVYSYSFNVFKYYLNEETETGLGNAKFRIYSDNGCENEIAVVSSGTNSDGYNTYRVATTNETGVDIVSAENGYITVSGLDSSTQYYLKEVAAPDGYHLLDNPIKVEIIANAKSDNTAVESITLKQDNTGVAVVEVLNQSGSILPVTGGIGTTIFYIVGGVIIVVALVLLIVRKRISDKKDKD
ncbi:MAG: SpaH/EbpB family LPXTG-anchored major pilin [Acutalibacteraceae bacterium]